MISIGMHRVEIDNLKSITGPRSCSSNQLEIPATDVKRLVLKVLIGDGSLADAMYSV